MSAVRAQRHIRSSACDDYLLALHVNGSAHAVQDDRRVTLGPGDFALFDPTRPYSITFLGAGTFEHLIYQVPRASLDARRLPRNTTALAVRAASALRTVAGPAGQLDLRRRSLADQLKRYALAHLGDPALSPDAAARASYISVRQLHRLFAHDGTSFGAWVREQRLRRCRDDLTSQQLSHRAIAEIAARWGSTAPRSSPAPSGRATASPRPNSAAPPAPPATGHRDRRRPASRPPVRRPGGLSPGAGPGCQSPPSERCWEATPAKLASVSGAGCRRRALICASRAAN